MVLYCCYIGRRYFSLVRGIDYVLQLRGVVIPDIDQSSNIFENITNLYIDQI